MASDFASGFYNATDYFLPVDPECNEIHYMNASDYCMFAMTVEDCVEIIEYIDYNYFIFCNFGNRSMVFPVIVCALWLFMLFIALGVTSNCFLCPNLFAISEHLGLSQNVAGVTLLAFGNGAPDIFSSAAGLQKASAELAIASLLGAGAFVTTVVAGSVFLTQNFTLTMRPFLRDICFYVAAVTWAFCLFHFGRYYVIHGIGFVAVYVVYIIVVLGSRFIYVSRAKNQSEKTEKNSDSKTCACTKLETKSQKYTFPDEQEAKGVVLKAYYFAGHDCFDDELPPLHDSHRQGTTNASFFDSATSIASMHLEKAAIEKSTEKLTCVKDVHGRVDDDSFLDFLRALSPVNLQKWSKYGWWDKICSIVKSPAVLVLKMTIPVVDTTSHNHKWCRYLNSLHCISVPVFVTLVSKYAFFLIGGSVPVCLLTVGGGTMASVTVLLTSESKRPPAYHWLFAYLGFAAAVTWIYCLANEIVALLQVFGVVFNLSDAVLGLTVLAWGNSLSDFLSNVAVARKNYPRMGISACFGGPLLALLLGLGVPLIVEVINGRSPATRPLIFSGQFALLFSTLAISLLTTTVTSSVWKFKTKRWYGALLLVLYVFFVALSVLEESRIFALL